MAEPLALCAERVLLARHETLGVLDQRSELLEPGAFRARPLLELDHTAGRRRESPPRVTRLGTTQPLRGPGECVQEIELMRRPREPPLGELPRQGEEPVGRGHQILPRDGSAPRVRARPAVAAHAARDDEAGLAVRAQIAECLEAVLVEEPVGHVELRLDVRLGAGRADRGGVALRPEEQADRLGDDRLPRAGLSGQGDEPGRELELGLADEDKVLDPQPAQHERIVDRRLARGTCPNPTRVREPRRRSTPGPLWPGAYAENVSR